VDRGAIVIAVDRHAGLPSLAPEWDALADRVGAVPFLRPGWVAAWEGAFAWRPLRILAARRDGRLVGVLPTMGRGATRSATNGHTPHSGILAEDAAVASALVRALYESRPRSIRVAYLDPAESGVATVVDAARAAGYRRTMRIVRSPYVAVDGDHDAYVRGRRRSFASDLRRRRRRLEEEGPVTLVGAQDGEDGRRLLDRLVTLEAMRRRDGTAIAGHASTRRFYGEVAAWAGARGTLRMLALCLGGRPLAVLLGVEESGVLWLLKGGYDPRYARFSPGQLVLGDAISQAFAAGLSRVELGSGTEPYKLQWTDAVRDRVTVHAYAPTVAGSLCWIAAARGRPLAERAGLDRRLRPLRDGAATASEPMRTGARRRVR
jgi:CelD/BcsL family acetyltransferase involved in cellulose biosynthesis